MKFIYSTYGLFLLQDFGRRYLLVRLKAEGKRSRKKRKYIRLKKYVNLLDIELPIIN